MLALIAAASREPGEGSAALGRAAVARCQHMRGDAVAVEFDGAARGGAALSAPRAAYRLRIGQQRQPRADIGDRGGGAVRRRRRPLASQAASTVSPAPASRQASAEPGASGGRGQFGRCAGRSAAAVGRVAVERHLVDDDEDADSARRRPSTAAQRQLDQCRSMIAVEHSDLVDVLTAPWRPTPSRRRPICRCPCADRRRIRAAS